MLLSLVTNGSVTASKRRPALHAGSAVARLSLRFVSAFVDNPRGIARSVQGLVPFLLDLMRYRRLEHEAASSLRLRFRNLYPQLNDRFAGAGLASGHYFHQDVWAARRVFDAAPSEHVDVGSRVDGFVAHLLSFRAVTVMDLRPLDGGDSRLRFLQADIRSLPQPDRSVESLSCLHAIEHVGLGRYGDGIDPQGHISAMRELQRVVADGGRLYLSTPIGRERLEFNAHRILTPKTILKAFDELALLEFSAVDDDGRLVEHAEVSEFEEATYACGLFLFERASHAAPRPATEPAG